MKKQSKQILNLYLLKTNWFLDFDLIKKLTFVSLKKREIIGKFRKPISNSYIYFITIVLFFNFNSIFSQTRDNLSQIYSLVDSSVTKLVNSNKLVEGKYSLNLVSPENYYLLRERAKFDFAKNGIINNSSDSSNNIRINYSIDKAGVFYGDMFRDGWFGEYLLIRETTLLGTTSIVNSDKTFAKEFSFSKIDTVKLKSIKKLENSNLPFTKNDIPAEPFFSSLFEPFIAVGTVVVTVVLLFTVRSN